MSSVQNTKAQRKKTPDLHIIIRIKQQSVSVPAEFLAKNPEYRIFIWDKYSKKLIKPLKPYTPPVPAALHLQRDDEGTLLHIANIRLFLKRTFCTLCLNTFHIKNSLTRHVCKYREEFIPIKIPIFNKIIMVNSSKIRENACVFLWNQHQQLIYPNYPYTIRRMQQNGIIHVKCVEKLEDAENKFTFTAINIREFLQGRMFCSRCLRMYRSSNTLSRHKCTNPEDSVKLLGVRIKRRDIGGGTDLLAAVLEALCDLPANSDRVKTLIDPIPPKCKGNSILRKRKFESPLENLKSCCKLKFPNKINFNDIDIIRAFLGPTYEIQLWTRAHSYKPLTPAQPNPNALYYVNIYFDGEFHAIQYHRAFLNHRSFCNKCWKTVSRSRYLKTHVCTGICSFCRNNGAMCPYVESVTCKDCNCIFRSKICFSQHKGNGTCDQVKKCPKCNVRIQAPDTLINHQRTKCGQIKCRFCYETYRLDDAVDHKFNCYHPIYKSKPKCKLFIFYDIETEQKCVYDEDDAGGFIHRAVCLVSKRICINCNVETGECRQANKYICRGVETKYFMGKDCVRDFCMYLLEKRQLRSTVIAHNGGGFDHHLLIGAMMHQIDAQHIQITNKGRKIVTIYIRRKGYRDWIRIIDSYLMISMSLEKMALTFNLKTLKGHFPHNFTDFMRIGYVGPIPEREQFLEKNRARDDFDEWYVRKSKEIYNFNDEILKYCDDDVKILMQGCMKFREEFLDICDLCPFSNATTLAGLCQKAYRKAFMPKKSIGNIYNNDFGRGRRTSTLAIKWLHLQNREIAHLNHRIIHGRNQGEQRIQNTQFFADGTELDSNGRVVAYHEIYGCAYHGCAKCHLNENTPSACSNQISMGLARTQTSSREARIRSSIPSNIRFETIWECEIVDLLKNDAKLKRDYDTLNFVDLMNSRDALYGGRTEVFRLKAQGNIVAADVCSLYPYVMANRRFPSKNPTIELWDEEKSSQVDWQNESSLSFIGVVKCKILPPSQLHVPVLPCKLTDKLLFTLCHKCAIEKNQNFCTHADEQRALTGAWITPELQLAVRNGYRIMTVYEIWRYANSKLYSEKEVESGLFTKYIQSFVKRKHEASGFPPGCETVKQKKAYIEKIFKADGVLLNMDAIFYNEGRRYVAKLCLNTLWGRMAQRFHNTHTIYLNTWDDFINFYNEGGRLITEYNEHNDPDKSMRLIVKYQSTNHTDVTVPNTNAVLASFVTGYARMHLFETISQLGENLIYTDTDSAYFLRGGNEPEINNCLGGWTNETEDAYNIGSYISEIYCVGPKNYGVVIITQDGRRLEKTTIRGLTLNNETDTFNVEYLEQVVNALLNDLPAVTKTHRYKSIVRDKKHNLVTRDLEKIHRAVFDKRVVIDNSGRTRPFGTKKI